MPLETIYTIEEIADHLRVPIDAVRKEIQMGSLRALKIDEFIRVRESDFESYLGGTQPQANRDGKHIHESALGPGQDFDFTWPDGKLERFTNVREGVVPFEGREYHVKVGFTTRNSAGKVRKRSLVLVDRYATVEFVAADTRANGMMASIIKDRRGKQLPARAALPSEYNGLRSGPYRDIVNGPGASNGLAVICDSTDCQTMVRHALIRYKYRQERV